MSEGLIHRADLRYGIRLYVDDGEKHGKVIEKTKPKLGLKPSSKS